MAEKRKGLPRWLNGKEPNCQCRRFGFNPWVEKIPWRRKWQPAPVFLPGESHGQRRLAGYSPWGHKESDTTERLNNNNGEKKKVFFPPCYTMNPHFSVLLTVRCDLGPEFWPVGHGEMHWMPHSRLAGKLLQGNPPCTLSLHLPLDTGVLVETSEPSGWQRHRAGRVPEAPGGKLLPNIHTELL